jgi:uncharacterized protein (DUF2062 family)
MTSSPEEAPPASERPKGWKAFLTKAWNTIAGIKDSPHKIALGVGIGLFLGVLPGTGVAASIVVSLIFRANKPAAVAGSLAVNTWINLVAFPLAATIGATITGVSMERMLAYGQSLVQNFSWANFFTPLLRDVILGLLIGFMVIGLALGLVGYLGAFLISREVQRRHAISKD